MEYASAVDLDWFFRGWFYTTDNVDIALSEVKWYRLNSKNPEIENPIERKEAQNEFIGDRINKKELKGKHYSDANPEMDDFYNENDEWTVSPLDKKEYEKHRESLSDEEKEVLDAGYHFYELNFENKGGLVMPIILRFTFTDGTNAVSRHPAEIWLKNEDSFSKIFVFKKEVRQIELDPFLETADTDLNNNNWPPKAVQKRFDLYKSSNYSRENEMQRAKK